jgi:hypothetical protein
VNFWRQHGTYNLPMAFQVFELEDGCRQVRCASHGPVVHIVPRSDGTFTIQEEDITGPIYEDYRAALLAARKLGQDPDL